MNYKINEFYLFLKCLLLFYTKTINVSTFCKIIIPRIFLPSITKKELVTSSWEVIIFKEDSISFIMMKSLLLVSCFQAEYFETNSTLKYYNFNIKKIA